MKRLFQNLLLIGLMATAVFMYSCGEDTTEEPALAKPTITLSGDLLSQTTFEVGDSVGFNVSFTAEAEFSGFNYQVTINKDSVNEQTQAMQYVTPTDLGFTNNETSGMFGFSIMQEIPEELAGTTISLYLEVVDKENQIASETFDFAVIESINEFETVPFGGFNSESLGSSYDASSDSVFFASNLRGNAANQARIDFVYYFADTPQRTIAAPNNDEAELTWDAQNSSAWPFDVTENATTFQVADVGFDFDAASTSMDLSNAYSEVLTGESRITGLEVDDVVVFKLDASRGEKFGAFKVTAVDGNSSGSITLTVKIQK